VVTHRKLQRARRQGVPLPVIALVGYTNAGKSTLFNALTSAGTFESDQLFATLDPLLRRMTLPNGLDVVLSDTVGFVRKLPHDIIAAFRATLEEVRSADLLLHVMDVSNPAWREQADAVRTVLQELGAQNTPTIDICNKSDLLPAEPADRVLGACHLLVSARKGRGLKEVIERITSALDSFSIQVELKIPYGRSGLLSRLHVEGRVSSENYENDGIRLEVELPRSAAHSLREFLVRPAKV
jgi:GTP-binding protein HflX